MKTILLNFLLLISCTAFAQEKTVQMVNKLGSETVEKFNVLKSDRSVRHGEYNAFYRTVMVAHGFYQHGKRVGFWDFYNEKAKLIQAYNYDYNKVTYVDTTGRKGIRYFFSDSLKVTDTVTNPVKIGTFWYSLIPILYQDVLTPMVKKDYPDAKLVRCTHVITVSETGQLIKHEVMASADGLNKLYVLDDSKFDDDLKQFVPGMINNKPAVTKIYTIASVNLMPKVVTTRVITGIITTTTVIR